MSVPPPRRTQSIDHDPYAQYDGPQQYHDYSSYASGTSARSRSMRNVGTATGSGYQANNMADPPSFPPSYDTAVGADVGGGKPPSHHQSENSFDYGLPIDYTAYTDYIEEYANGEPETTTRPQSQELEDQFGNLSMAPDSYKPPGQYASPYGVPSGHPRQRSVTDGFNANPRGYDPSASVYSLDSGTHAMYGQQQPPAQRQYGGGPPVSFNPNFAGGPGGPPRPPGANLYYNAANDFLGPPPGTQSPYPSGPPHGPPRQQSMSNLSQVANQPNLARTNTTRSMMTLSSVSSVPPPQRQMSETGPKREGSKAIDINKPPYTREFVDDYRNRMKLDPDPEAQFSFAKYLIEAAKKIGGDMAARDPRAARKYRDNLLAESLRNVKKLAEAKEPYTDAQFFLANLYGTGQLGLQVDHEKAYYLYLMASKLNHPAATYRAAVCCELGAGTKRDATRAVLFYRKSAALGDTAAMYKFALILLNGLMGHPRNPREAYIWLRRAVLQADEDNPHALHELALLHERQNNGTSGVIPFDPHAAREYLIQAAQFGYAPSQFKLGQCHEFGNLGFPIDPRRSIAWYTRAAERGDSEAELALSGWYLTGSEGVLKQSDNEAYLWGHKAAAKGLAKAEYAVGYYHEIGIGTPQDMDKAKRWYQRAAMQGNKRAMQRLQELNNSKLEGKGARPTRKDAETECVIM